MINVAQQGEAVGTTSLVYVPGALFSNITNPSAFGVLTVNHISYWAFKGLLPLLKFVRFYTIKAEIVYTNAGNYTYLCR